MQKKIKQIITKTIARNISYYDTIAGDYNHMMGKEDSNIQVRKLVEAKFREIVNKGSILDFGGGTGLDLDWLNEAGYNIIFCEPSVGMRQIAINRWSKDSYTGNIFFLEGQQTDFMKWDTALPFTQKAEGVLANFAVLNCIPNLSLFFDQMYRILGEEGKVVALILDRHSNKILHLSWLSRIKSFLLQRPLIVDLEHRQQKQTIYIHSINEIKKASEKNFVFLRTDRLEEYGFTIIYLVRK